MHWSCSQKTKSMLSNFISREKQQFDKRIHEIDLFRGFLIILVMFDHFMWCLSFYIFHHQNPELVWYMNSELRKVIREVVLCAFMFTCGISCFLSRNNKRRGLLLLALVIAIAVVTHLLQLLPLFDNRVIIIDFNILGVIALSILVFSLVEKRRSVDICLVIFALIAFYSFLIIKPVDSSETYNPFLNVLYPFTDPVKGKNVADYLPLFPYIIFLFLGVLFSRQYYVNKISLFKKKGNWERPICLLGRHTLIVYVLQEIILTGLCMLIGLAF